MIKRTIEISREPAHLTVQLEQLLLKRDGQTVASIPCEDVGVVLVDHPGTTYSHAALAQLASVDAAVVVCGRDHLPAAILLPLADHSQVVWRVRDQVALAGPLRKQLWKQIVQAKIRAQAANLSAGPARTRLLELARTVRSGDPKNHEAQASRVYWSAFFESIAFRRDRFGDGPNPLLNYGYAVLRAAIARAIVAAGLLPSLGIKHSNRANAFCLADDLIEPLRPLVDARVKELLANERNELDQQTKAALLELLTIETQVGDETGPLMVNLHRMVASLVKCFQGKAKAIEFPEPLKADSPNAESRIPTPDSPAPVPCN
ncbi:MAG: type II CRISPR-associated endonuclease Cas1 [Planctomycetota bacterium]|nr:MAG: type II CRISPR-associated endonuclease Cas1 [Planctomycetota bacterium]